MRKIQQICATQAEDGTTVILAIDDEGHGWKLIGASGQRWMPLPDLPETREEAKRSS